MSADTLDRSEMQSFFDAPIEELIKKIDAQFAELTAKNLKLDVCFRVDENIVKY